jgi:hypothetical protein
MSWRDIGGEVWLHLFFIQALGVGEWSASCPGYCLGQEAAVAIEYEAGGRVPDLVWMFWRREKSLDPARNWTAVHPASICLTILTELPQLLSSLNSVIQTACDTVQSVSCLTVYQRQDDWQCIRARMTGSGSGTGCLVVYQGQDDWQWYQGQDDW